MYPKYLILLICNIIVFSNLQAPAGYNLPPSEFYKTVFINLVDGRKDRVIRKIKNPVRKVDKEPFNKNYQEIKTTFYCYAALFSTMALAYYYDTNTSL